jgi:ThiF family
MTSSSAQNGAATNGQVNRRYDRQIRIWGAHGQALLQEARVCVLGAGPVATETLKNLVLGGIASFTVVDHEQVTERDLGNNFFLGADALGTSRAEACTKLLRELNDSVQGSYSDVNIHELLKSTTDYFKDFSLVIACEVRVDGVATDSGQLSTALRPGCAVCASSFVIHAISSPTEPTLTCACFRLTHHLRAGHTQRCPEDRCTLQGGGRHVHACPHAWALWHPSGARHSGLISLVAHMCACKCVLTCANVAARASRRGTACSWRATAFHLHTNASVLANSCYPFPSHCRAAQRVADQWARDLHRGE